MQTAFAADNNAPIPDCGIAVMAKASIPGRTKTRLVPPLTFDEAARCNTAFLSDIADNILAAAARSSIAGYMAFGPPDAKSFFQECLPDEIGLIEAWHPNFGDCLVAAIAQLLERGHRSAVVLNSDSPTLPTSLLADTAAMLALPGDRAELRLSVHTLPTWYDVDDVATLKILQAELFESGSFAPDLRPNHPRHTRALMESLLANPDFKDRLSFNAFRRAAE